MTELYKQEILELTNLLKYDKGWKYLKEFLIKRGFNINKVLLVSYLEDEEENEYAIIITKDIEIIEIIIKNKYSFYLKSITNEHYKIYELPQILIGINMIKDNQIL